MTIPQSQLVHTYTLHVLNISPENGSMCVFSQHKQENWNDMITVAWQVQPSGQSVLSTFQWQVKWELFYQKSGATSAAEYVFKPVTDANSAPADPNEGTTYRLGKDFTLTSVLQPDSNARGRVHIKTTDIPLHSSGDAISVGISLNSKPWIVQNANPNFSYSFEAESRPVYNLALGNFVEGKNIADFTHRSSDPIEVYFPRNVYTAYAILDSTRTFTLSHKKPERFPAVMPTVGL